MICYNCGLKVHSYNSTECHFCGVKFGMTCNICKAPNPPMAKFCCQCGNPLSGLVEGGSVQNYTTLAESRKDVAVLFADVSGFTALSEKLDPEIVREIINDCFTYITAPVYELGGTIDKYIGDCVMVLFGAKINHIDDAKRAVLCAVKMNKLIKEFSDEKIKPLGFELQLSIGVHYGLVVTGSVGNYYDMDYTVMGDTVNTAQRIQSNTPKSSIYVSDAVYKETYIDVEYSESITISVKNKANPIICYIPLSIKNSLSSSKENIPMVGRQDCLRELIKIFETSKNNNTCVAGIIGPAGIGKSTLIENFLYLNKDEQKIIKTECNPSLSNSPYSLISRLLMNIMNISSGEPLIVKQSRIISYISFLLADYDEEIVKRNYQFISFLMGLEIDKETKDILSSMDTISIFKEITNQLILLFQEFENRFRTLIFIEDLHWADAKSVALLNKIWASCISNGSGRNLYIYTSRSMSEGFKELRNDSHKIIPVNPLDAPSVIEYIKLYIGCIEVTNDFSDYIYEFSAGNPLYMYELLRYIKKVQLYNISKDKVFLQEGINKTPDSLQGLILSKLNYLSQGATEIAQAASIIGKDFSIAVINKLLKTDVEADKFLKEAVDNNIIYPKNTYTYSNRIEKIYSFTHETEREAIYKSILHKKKINYHRNIGKAIENLYERDLESHYEVLGEHFEKGGDLSKAAAYYTSAAQHYKHLFNTQEALDYFIKAFNSLNKNNDGNRDPFYQLCIEIGELYTILSDFKNAKNFLNKALKLADNNNERWYVELDLASIYNAQSKYKKAMDIINNIQEQMKQDNKLYGGLLFLKCNIQRVIGQSQEALNNIKKAESVLLKNKDYDNLAKVLNAAGTIYHATSDIDNALKHYQRAYKYSEKTGDLLTLMKCSGNMAAIFHVQGDLTNATKYFNIAMEHSKKISHMQSYVTNSNNFGILYLDKGLFRKAKSLFEEAVRISKETSTLYMQSASLSNLADVEYYLGDYKAAKKYASQALEISKEIEDIEGEGINNISLAKTSIEQGFMKEAKEYLDFSFKIYSELNSEDGWSDYHYYLAQYYLKLNKLDKCQEQAQLSLELAFKCQNNRKQAKALRLLGIILQQNNDYIDSLEKFKSSIDLLEKEEASYELAKSLYLRAVSNKKLNMNEAAEKDLKTALVNIQKIDKCKWTKKIEYGIK